MGDLPTISRAIAHKRKVLAAAALATLCWSFACYSPAQAAVIFTATATTPATVSLSDQIRGPSFSFGLYAVQVFGAARNACPQRRPEGTHWDLRPLDRKRSIQLPGDVLIAPLFNGPSLLKGPNNFFGFSVYAASGSNTATFELTSTVSPRPIFSIFRRNRFTST